MLDPHRSPAEQVVSQFHRAVDATTRRSAAIAAAALNVTGLSLGYLYLGAFRRGAAAFAGTLVIVGGTVILVLPGAPWAALLIVVVWLAVLAVDGWRLGRHRRPVDDRLATVSAPFPQMAVAAAVIAAIVIGSVEYVDVRYEVLAAGRELHSRGDCEGARREYARLEEGFQFNTSLVETARRLSKDCALYLDAGQMKKAGRSNETLARLAEHARRYVDSPLANRVYQDATDLLKPHLAAGRDLHSRGDCEGARREYTQLLGFPFNTSLAETARRLRKDCTLYLDAGQLETAGRPKEALARLDEHASRYADSPLAERARRDGVRIATKLLVSDGLTPPDWSTLSAHLTAITVQWPDTLRPEDIADALAAGYEKQLSSRQTERRFCDAVRWIGVIELRRGPGTEAAASAAEELRPWMMFGCVQERTNAGTPEADAAANKMVEEMASRYSGSLIAVAAQLYASRALQKINSGAEGAFWASVGAAGACVVLGFVVPPAAGVAAACVTTAVSTAGAAGTVEALTDAALVTLECLPQIDVGDCAIQQAVASLLVPKRHMPKRPARTKKHTNQDETLPAPR